MSDPKIDEDHIAERSVDTYEHTLPGLGKCEEIISEGIDPEDGTPIDRIVYKPMVGNPLHFSNPQTKRYRENVDKIDWNE